MRLRPNPATPHPPRERIAPLPHALRLLILGGTSDANQLARALVGQPGLDALVSLAGRTREPVTPPLPTRIGGFGGADGLADFLQQNAIDAVVDATHPFAARITASAQAACAQLGLPIAIVTRPPWTAGAGDRWLDAADLPAAAEALGPVPRRVFLTSGRLGLAAFKAAPQHDYLVRTIDPPDAADLPPRCRVVLARGPFTIEAETQAMDEAGIELLVTKNSGAAASAAKLAAARGLGLPVVMVRPPARPEATTFFDLPGILGWIAARHRSAP